MKYINSHRAAYFFAVLTVIFITGCKLNVNGIITATGTDDIVNEETSLKVVSTTDNDLISAANQSAYELEGECSGLSEIHFSSLDFASFSSPCTNGLWSAVIDFTTLDAATVDLVIEGKKNGQIVKTVNYSLNKRFEPTRIDTKLGQLSAGSTDGTGTSAMFSQLSGVTTDGTMLYISDRGNHTIKKANMRTLEVVTIAGTAGITGSVNGSALSATFNTPSALCYTNGSLFITDTTTHLIRRLDLSTNIVETFAGDGTLGSTDGIGTAAKFNGPRGIACEGTTLWITDTANRKIRKINITTQEVTTVAGSGAVGTADGIGTAATFNWPHSIVAVGNALYVQENFRHSIRKIVKSTGEVTTFAGVSNSLGTADGIGSAARFNRPLSVATDGTHLYVADGANFTIRKINIATAEVTTMAGTTGVAGTVDGPLMNARITNLFHLFYFSNHIYITSNTMLRAIH